ncbi:MAG: hypothetical protein ACRC33_19810, partial [Gemmataceae bacterium]
APWGATGVEGNLLKMIQSVGEGGINPLLFEQLLRENASADAPVVAAGPAPDGAPAEAPAAAGLMPAASGTPVLGYVLAGAAVFLTAVAAAFRSTWWVRRRRGPA